MAIPLLQCTADIVVCPLTEDIYIGVPFKFTLNWPKDQDRPFQTSKFVVDIVKYKDDQQIRCDPYHWEGQIFKREIYQSAANLKDVTITFKDSNLVDSDNSYYIRVSEFFRRQDRFRCFAAAKGIKIHATKKKLETVTALISNSTVTDKNRPGTPTAEASNSRFSFAISPKALTKAGTKSTMVSQDGNLTHPQLDELESSELIVNENIQSEYDQKKNWTAKTSDSLYSVVGNGSNEMNDKPDLRDSLMQTISIISMSSGDEKSISGKIDVQTPITPYQNTAAFPALMENIEQSGNDAENDGQFGKKATKRNTNLKIETGNFNFNSITNIDNTGNSPIISDPRNIRPARQLRRVKGLEHLSVDSPTSGTWKADIFAKQSMQEGSEPIKTPLSATGAVRDYNPFPIDKQRRKVPPPIQTCNLPSIMKMLDSENTESFYSYSNAPSPQIDCVYTDLDRLSPAIIEVVLPMEEFEHSNANTLMPAIDQDEKYGLMRLDDADERSLHKGRNMCSVETIVVERRNETTGGAIGKSSDSALKKYLEKTLSASVRRKNTNDTIVDGDSVLNFYECTD
ncbi:hypothetical protein HK098_005186 [Nowakowskiella sp. JEL0407]|nr:hypothetical protein HK098_005186 [Nowakowskiella sp. JEL0407]